MAPPMYGDKSEGMPSAWGKGGPMSLAGQALSQKGGKGKGKGKKGEKGGPGGGPTGGMGCSSTRPAPPDGWKMFASVPEWVGYDENGNPGAARRRGPPSNVDVTVGDWPCPNLECSNWNWAKRDDCGKCFTPHPTRVKEVFMPTKQQSKADQMQDRRAGLDTGRQFTTGHGSREGSGGGYKEVDQEAEYRKKRRREEEKQEAAERKKTKQRCKVCKRYACVC